MQKNLIFLWNNLTFDQQDLSTGLKTQNVEKLSLDLIFIANFCQNIKSFCKHNSMLIIHSKPFRNWQELTVCSGNNFFPFDRNIPGNCNDIGNRLIAQMNLWNDDSNCGKVSESCPKMPCGQNCLYTVSC